MAISPMLMAAAICIANVHDGDSIRTCDRERVEHLSGRYGALVNPLERLGATKNRRVARKSSSADGG